MKFLRLLCLAGALSSALSAGTIVFSNISEQSLASDPVDIGGPLYDSFTSSVGGQIIDLQLLLSADSPSDTVHVGLYANNSDTPGAEIATLANVSGISSTLEICEISLSPGLGQCEFTLAASPWLDAGTRYWIGLSGTTSVQWSFAGNDNGIGVAGEFFANQAGTASDSGGPYQMQVTVSPEPATALLIFAGAAGLALLRRRAA